MDRVLGRRGWRGSPRCRRRTRRSASLAFFRSPNPHRSWITAAGAVLDAAALRLAVLNIPFTPDAGALHPLGLPRAARDRGLLRLRLRRRPGARRSDQRHARRVRRGATTQLGARGVPVRPDRERAWRDFAGWRVNYDGVLLALAGVRHGAVRAVDLGSLVADAAGAAVRRWGVERRRDSSAGGSTVSSHVRKRSTPRSSAACGSS